MCSVDGEWEKRTQYDLLRKKLESVLSLSLMEMQKQNARQSVWYRSRTSKRKGRTRKAKSVECRWGIGGEDSIQFLAESSKADRRSTVEGVLTTTKERTDTYIVVTVTII